MCPSNHSDSYGDEGCHCHSHTQQKELFVCKDPTSYNEPTTRSQMAHPLV